MAEETDHGPGAQPTEEPESTPGNSQTSGVTARELLERMLLLGVGAAAVTKDKAENLVDEFVRRGHLSREEGKDMVEKVVERSREQARSALRRADNSLHGTFRELGLAGKRELEDLDFRLRQLEHRLSLLEAEADKHSGAPSSEDSSGASGR